VYAERSLRDTEYVISARHTCGSRLVVRIAEGSLATRRDRDAFDFIVDTIDDAGCCCVPREVLVPCTAQRCG
jgi:hypothetical protein